MRGRRRIFLEILPQSHSGARILRVKFSCGFVRWAAVGGFIFLALWVAAPARALEPSEILLITNKNSPDSQRLAALYCQLRGVPKEQMVALDLPNAEEMPFQTYEESVVGPVRQFISDHRLQPKIKCLLTFYGVPFRIAARRNSDADQQEYAELTDLRAATIKELGDTVVGLEKRAGEMDPTFLPGAGDTVEALLARTQAAIAAIGPKVSGLPQDSGQMMDLQRFLKISLETIRGRSVIDQIQHGEPPQLHEAVAAGLAQIRQLRVERWNHEARSNLRRLTLENFGLSGLVQLLDAQLEYFKTDGTAAATDNELSLLYWDYYPRPQWIANPLKFDFGGRAPATLMTMRLDGPDPATVEKMMRTCVQVEKTGLRGIVAIDARGLQPIDDKGNLSAYGEFDETLRQLAYLLRLKTNLKIRLDDQDLVFPAHSVKNVALYCGWYSVGNYIPGCDFNPGAVGYHVASYEMVSLHNPSKEWVRGLLTDGVVGTLGAVAEPYLDAFPKPDEFFPLLLTGKLTLAEVYWKTTPDTSWMIDFVGDPLYTPYKVDPAIKVEDLPPGLRRAFR